MLSAVRSRIRSTRPASAASASGTTRARFREALLTYVGLLVVMVALSVFFAASEPSFATYDNLINVLQTNAVLLILSIGLTFTVLAGGFDLSIGGVLVLSSVGLAKLLGAGVPVGLAIAIVIVGSVLFGLVVNGLTIAWLGVSFFVVTLGTLTMTRGLALLISHGEGIGLYDEKVIRKLGDGTVASVPIPVIIALAILGIAVVITRYTGFGRMVYAVGGNAEAARVAGIKVTAVRVATYAIAAGLAGLAGVLEAGRLASADPTSDAGIELTAAAAVLLGGTTFAGGVGTMLGTFLGVLFLGVLQNGLLLGSISIYWQGIVTGAVLFAAVVFDRIRAIRRVKRQDPAAEIDAESATTAGTGAPARDAAGAGEATDRQLGVPTEP